MTPYIQIHQLTKNYESTTALHPIQLTFEKGKVYGLIGRNGAGKTTLLKLLANMLQPSGGRIDINEVLLTPHPELCFSRDFNLLYANQKAKNLFSIASTLYPRWDKALCTDLIERFELPYKKEYTKLSKGQQTIISLIIALCSNATVLLLDEPYSGLDPVNREQFYQLLSDLYFNEEKTVIFSSHLISEVEGYFEHGILLHRGQVLINDTMENIRAMSYVIEGNAQVIDYLKTHKKVLKVEKLAGLSTSYVFDHFTEVDFSTLKSLGATLRAMDLQKLMVQLTLYSEGKQ